MAEAENRGVSSIGLWGGGGGGGGGYNPPLFFKVQVEKYSSRIKSSDSWKIGLNTRIF